MRNERVFALMGIILSVALSGCTENDNGGSSAIARIETSKGAIEVELYENKMPETAENFIKLAEDGFYDGLIFHRIKANFMIQSGLMYPNGTTKQSPYGTIPFESHPNATHVDGAISMASTAPGAGGSSQFFICDGAQHFLDGQYAAFGKVIDGMSVVRDIASASHDGSLEPSPGGGRPVEDIIINHIVIK
jgi:cyclophilin family peptidyl-prolyl cis-trans isomerase